MFNDNLIEDFMNNFFRYGKLFAYTCFIGMEEGGGNTIEDVESRLETWFYLGETSNCGLCKISLRNRRGEILQSARAFGAANMGLAYAGPT